MAGPSLGAGALLALSVPPFGWWPLAFLGAGLLFWRLGGLALRTRLLAGWLAGLGCYVIGLFWARNFNWYGALALIAAEALSMAAAAALTPPRAGRLPAFAGAFTLAEWVRWTWPFGGLPIGGVFLGQAGGPFLATARLGGPLLLTGIVWLGGGALGSLLPPAAAQQGGAGTARPRRSAAVAGCALVAVVLLAAVAPNGGPGVRRLEVTAVQGGGRRGVTMEEVDPASVFIAQQEASAGLGRAGAGTTSLVVWPEDVISLAIPLPASPQGRAMADLARRTRSTVVAGVTTTAGTPQGTFRNEVVAWGPSGRVVSTFEKVHRVPFGEYVPYRGFFSHFANLSEVPLDAVPGHGSGLLRTPAGPLGIMVSYEVFYGGRSRASVRDGAELLVVPTNTSSYATSQVPSQEVAMDRVQAVSEGRDLVQAAPTGFSSLVTSSGGVLQRSDLGGRAVLSGVLWLRTGTTLYAWAGDLPVLVLCGLALAVGWRRELIERRRSHADLGWWELDHRRPPSLPAARVPQASTVRPVPKPLDARRGPPLGSRAEPAGDPPAGPTGS